MYREENSNTTSKRRAKNPVRRKKIRGKAFAMMLSLVLLLSIVAGATVAFLATSRTVGNTFVAGNVSCKVNDALKVENKGNVAAFIRAAVTVNWVDSEGYIRGIAPVAGTDYSISAGTNWSEKGGYYYYSSAVLPNAATENPVCTISQKAQCNGYTLTVEIVAEAIQAVGTNDNNVSAVMNAWGVNG